MNRRTFLTLGVGAGTAAVIGGMLGYSCVSSEYQDVSGFSDDTEQGRTKNSIAAVVAGLIAHKQYGAAELDVNVEKQWWPDAKVTGTTTEKSIDTFVDLALTSAHFTAQKNEQGYLVGKVSKSEFDWEVKQTGPDKYEIMRWGPKFNAELQLSMKNGAVVGKYVRPGPNINWGIAGTYDDQGNISVEIGGALTLGIRLVGKVTKGQQK